MGRLVFGRGMDAVSESDGGRLAGIGLVKRAMGYMQGMGATMIGPEKLREAFGLVKRAPVE